MANSLASQTTFSSFILGREEKEDKRRKIKGISSRPNIKEEKAVWLVRLYGEALKRRLVHSAALTIMA